MNYLTPANITFVLGLIGILFTVFKLIFYPQKEAKTNELLLDQKANFLRDEYDKKFATLDIRFAEITKDNQNHLHTLEKQMDTLTNIIIQQGKDLVRLETTINIKLK